MHASLVGLIKNLISQAAEATNKEALVCMEIMSVVFPPPKTFFIEMKKA